MILSGNYNLARYGLENSGLGFAPGAGITNQLFPTEQINPIMDAGISEQTAAVIQTGIDIGARVGMSAGGEAIAQTIAAATIPIASGVGITSIPIPNILQAPRPPAGLANTKARVTAAFSSITNALNVAKQIYDSTKIAAAMIALPGVVVPTPDRYPAMYLAKARLAAAPTNNYLTQGKYHMALLSMKESQLWVERVFEKTALKPQGAQTAIATAINAITALEKVAGPGDTTDLARRKTGTGKSYEIFDEERTLEPPPSAKIKPIPPDAPPGAGGVEAELESQRKRGRGLLIGGGLGAILLAWRLFV